MHGRYDEVIPYKHGVAISSAAKNSRLLSYDCGHNDFAPGWFGFGAEVETFLTNAGIIAAGQSVWSDYSSL